MYSSGIIDFVTVIIMLIVIYEDIFGDQHREVIHDGYGEGIQPTENQNLKKPILHLKRSAYSRH